MLIALRLLFFKQEVRKCQSGRVSHRNMQSPPLLLIVHLQEVVKKLDWKKVGPDVEGVQQEILVASFHLSDGVKDISALG